MPACGICGEEHAVLDPSFRRPEAFVRLDAAVRELHAKATDDLCSIHLPDADSQWFVRGVLPVEVVDRSEDLWWGVWAEVSEPVFRRILEVWSDPAQDQEPPFDGKLANVIPSYPDTLGLPLIVQLTGARSRPRLQFGSASGHPFVLECQAGINAHRASDWNRLIENA
jgi:hypothetical protein